MSIREYEAVNVIAPLENSDAMKSQANLAVSNASGLRWSLTALFGRSLDQGHYLTIQADGAKLYAKLAPNNASHIDAFATGTGATIGYPIPDGAQITFVPVPGRETGTGVATLAVYDWLHLRTASGGVATAYARVYRSSLAPGQDAGEFRAP